MLEFRRICAEDKPLFDIYRQKDRTGASEGAFATLFIWDEYYRLKIAENGEFLFLRFEIKGKEPSYFFPIGSGDTEKALLQLKEYSESKGERLLFRLVTEDKAELLKRLFPGKFDYTYERDSADYVYLTEKLCTLSGKKLHSKRNHLNYFKENYDYTYEAVDTPEKLRECARRAYELVENKTRNLNPFELGAMKKYFNNYFKFNQTGALLRVGGKICAMTFGERLTEDMALVQIELAEDEVRGSYQMINKLFCENAFKDCKYINREEDMGLEGLRRAKQSYQPALMIDKYTIKEKG